MVQAYASKLLNQKESAGGAVGGYASDVLFEATERAEAALERLEGGVRRAANARQDTEEADEKIRFFKRENENLRQERESLNLAIEQLKKQYGDLHKAASTVYNKLSDTIKRLTQIIGD